MDEIRPPMIMRDRPFVLLPDVQGRSADTNDVFGRLGPSGTCGEKAEEEENGEALSHNLQRAVSMRGTEGHASDRRTDRLH
jgi:hypothetical protein